MTDETSSRPKLPSQSHRTALVSGRKTLRFTFAPDICDRALIASSLGLLDLPAFQFKGEFSPLGRADVVLRADLTALVVQACSITLAPVRSKLVEVTQIRFQHDFVEPNYDDLEIPEDDCERLPELIDVAAVAIEALALALPLYPRVRGTEFGEAGFAGPGIVPLKTDDLKPFAGLATLAEKLKNSQNLDD